MKAVTSEFGTNASAQDKLAAQNETLTKTIEKQEEKLAMLQDGLAKSAEKYGEESTQTLKWQQAVNEATAALNKSKNQLDDNNRALEEMGDETNNVAKATEDLGEAQDRIGTLGKAMLATLTAAAVAAGKVITDIVKSSLDAVGNYEQLVGGVETLFGDSAVKVLRNAADAYKTAGLSANEYMETVTSFSASLLQGLGGDTEKAADLANQALIDMADNANKMGTDMSSIMNAYQGFAKQNYTLLDNLKLGYGGTATEMVRLINHANELDSTILGANKTIEKMDEVSFDQIIRSIHTVQDEIGITGTTALEASTTIEGSMQAAKAAWDNFLSGAGDATAFTEAFGTALDNIVDNLKVIIPRVVEGLSQMVDKIMPLIPDIISDFLPVVIKGITSLVSGVVKALPKLLKTIGKALAENLESVLAVAWIPVLAFQSNITKAFSKIPSTISGGFAKIGTSLKTWANSIGGVVTIISMAIGGISLLYDAWKSSGVGQLITETKEFAEAQERLAASADEMASKAQSEWDYYARLKTELDSIVDSNGKIQEGYEERAGFIAGELSDALGIEMEVIDGNITGWENLGTAIDNAIEKKRAYALVDAHEEEYQAALESQNGLLERAAELQQKINDKRAEIDNYSGFIPIGTLESELAQLEGALDSTLAQLGNTFTTTSEYSAAMAAAMAGDFATVDSIYGLSAGAFVDMTSANKAEMDAYIADMQTKIAILTQIYQTTGDEQARIAAENMQKMLDDTIAKWGLIDEATATGVEGMATAITDGTEGVTTAASNLVDDVGEKMSKESQLAGFDKAGKDAALGFADGLQDYTAVQQVISKARYLAQRALDALRAGLDEHSPSRAMMEIGELATKGFAIGLVNGLSSVRAAMTKTVNTVEAGMAGAVPTPQPTTASLAAGVVNGLASASPAVGGTLTVNLVMPDGKRLAQETIKDFIGVARANGTPITAY